MSPHPLRSIAIPLGLLLGFGSGEAVAAEDGPDTSHWDCRFCQFDYGWRGFADLGFEYADAASYRLGEYTGLRDDGAYLLAGGEASYRNEHGAWFDAVADELGLLSRRIDARGGRQGLYELHGSWQQIPQFRYGNAVTPFVRDGERLNLPEDWVAAGATDQMSALDASLHSLSLDTRRSRFALGGSFTPRASAWNFAFDLREDRVAGASMLAGSVLTAASQLPLPVDQLTHQLDASVARRGDNWQLALGFYGSYFEQDVDALEWSNPYTAYSGATEGRASTAPDNSFNQLSLSGAWQLLPSTRLTANLSYGRGRQDQDYIEPTINDTLGVAALPQSSLDGRVDTVNHLLRLSARPARGLSLTAQYTLDQRKNHTDMAEYQQVPSDAYVGEYRVNLPYSYKRQAAEVEARYRLRPDLQFLLGGEKQRYDRSYQEVARTQTTKAWAGLRTSLLQRIDLDLRYTHSSRSVSSWHELDVDGRPLENPLLRRFNLAARTRNAVSVSGSFSPHRGVMLAADFQWREDRYDDTQIGLTRAEDRIGTIDAGWTPVADVSLHAYTSLERIESQQAGSRRYSTPDWYGSSDDTIRTIGFDGQWKQAINKADLGLNYSDSRASESVGIDAGASAAGFPDNDTRFRSLRFYARYPVNARMTTMLSYAWQSLRYSDWSLDGLEPDTVSNLLATATGTPTDHERLLILSLRYAF
ncbi:MtrB/PioB family decaheme-associated outer membrane protein [Algiphilus sp. W345]|uniref:MtrB/PioB family decaheme-associated outer membrane protein n=1 Tax=Banduia mediterranea TaxID=3075609 RepID=A0ABU2WJN8_9GAMM|nr:MtrB/PioB family decaheme-associated outer membrane protein [Algiphilus sp. W345]MDT0497834.1 MtrB/PioB family decaheme-associated outer membrane protein [Algiphilus sp. W345]